MEENFIKEVATEMLVGLLDGKTENVSTELLNETKSKAIAIIQKKIENNDGGIALLSQLMIEISQINTL
jgi:hypothetical protein